MQGILIKSCVLEGGFWAARPKPQKSTKTGLWLQNLLNDMNAHKIACSGGAMGGGRNFRNLPEQAFGLKVDSQ